MQRQSEEISLTSSRFLSNNYNLELKSAIPFYINIATQ